MHAAAVERDDRELKRMAWALSHVMSLFTKKPVSVEDLLGLKKEKQPRGKRVFLEDVLGGGQGLEEKLKRFDENWQKRKELRRRKQRGRTQRKS